MITGVGWAGTFVILGIIGMGSGVAGFLIIMEPTRGTFDEKKPEEENKVGQGDTVKMNSGTLAMEVVQRSTA